MLSSLAASRHGWVVESGPAVPIRYRKKHVSAVYHLSGTMYIWGRAHVGPLSLRSLPIVSQPPVDEQRRIEGTQLQDWQQQQQALSAATPVHTGLGGSLPAASVWGGSYLQVAEQQPCPGRGSRGHLAASSGRAVVQQQGQQHTSALVLSRPRLSNSLSGPRP